MRDKSIWTDIKPFQSHYLGLCNHIKDCIKGRELVFWGEAPLLEELLKNKYDIVVKYVFTSNEELLKKGGRYHKKNTIEKMTHDDIFICIPFLDYDDNLKHYLESFGYKEFFDYIFYKHKKKILHRGSKCEYHDNYGNHINSNGAFDIAIGELVWNCDIEIADDVKADANSVIDVCGGNSHVTIKERNTFGARTKIIIRNNSAVEIDEGCSFWSDVSFHAEYGTGISIGKDNMFSKDITLITSDGHSIFDVESGQRRNPYWPLTDRYNIVLGNHVWVGMRAMILASNIGNSSIVGAASMIKGKFPNNCIVGGVPGKIIRTDITWSRDPYAENIMSCGIDNINYTENN